MSNDDFDLPRWQTYRPRTDSHSPMSRPPPQPGFYPAQDPYSPDYVSPTAAPSSATRSPVRVDPYAAHHTHFFNPQLHHARNLSHPKHDYPFHDPQTHLAPQGPARTHSLSNPPTPLSYIPPQHSPAPHYYNNQDHQMVLDPPPKRRPSGFRRVRTVHDLQPRVENSTLGRRLTSDGIYLSPLRHLTTHLVETYHICNPQFRYESAHNPRRVLTKPSKPTHNDGYDNDDYDYILYVNDWLGTEEGHKYLILDILGQGTFGQVVKCQNMKTHEVVAVKVVKNKPAYFNQSMMEVTILELLNNNYDASDEHHILRLRDSFIHRNHLCLVFELLSSNLYELIKQNQFQGLSTQLVKVFMAQLLDALTILKDARLIHCDLKPENILLKSLHSPQIKIIDFGSACHERQTVYTYIQSRFYRSPEVLLGMSYTSAIDMWSLGCIAVELFLGLPLFPGTSEYNQLFRIIEMLGMPPMSMLNTGKQVSQFFDSYEVWNSHTNQNERKHKLKSMEQYSREHGTNEQPGKQYFKATTLHDIINTAPIPQIKSSRSSGNEVEKEMANRAAFIDFCQGLLTLNPVTRWTPQQARMHPFITGEKFTKPFIPDNPIMVSHHIQPAAVTDPKRPYGGLVPSQPKGQRAYYDAAAYNHQLAQHQAYTTQAASQAANSTRNPYMVPHPPAPQQQPQQQPQQPQHQHHAQAQAPPPPPQAQSSASYQNSPDVNMSSSSSGGGGGGGGGGLVSYQPQQMHSHPGPYVAATGGQQGRAPLTHQSSSGQLGGGGGVGGQYGPSQPAPPSQPQTHIGSASNSYPSFDLGGTGAGPNGGPNSTSSSRARANTINQMDAVPPALARLQHMNQDVIGGRNALTPVLNRDDAMREWERRQQGGKPAQVQPYPQLEYLQQQAEMVAASGGGWPISLHPGAAAAHGGHVLNHAGHRFPPQPSKLSHSYHPPTSASAGGGGGNAGGGGGGSGASAASAILVDDDSSTGIGSGLNVGMGGNVSSARRDAIMSSVRNAARVDASPGQGGTGAGGGVQGQGVVGGVVPLSSSMSISSPPQSYGGGMPVTGNRYAATYGAPPSVSSQQQQQQQSHSQSQSQGQNSSNPGSSNTGGSGGGGGVGTGGSVFDAIVDRRATDIGAMYAPMQPDTYHHPQQQTPGQQQYGGAATQRHIVAPPQQAVPASFYGAGVVPTGAPSQPPGGQGQGGQQRNPFSNMPVPDTSGVLGVGGMAGVGVGVGVGMGKPGPPDARRGNGMDAWPR